ncbi:protein POLLENLESS 3-like [Actinidia eriantha]|uniref:protein POLLENLESS 3-like n=1 Tax=Actinidia eriantha TaxID=165200 RepID=UPI00258ACED4|nr:protein POLLENLESS 3-like [Actinidia eriantha]
MWMNNKNFPAKGFSTPPPTGNWRRWSPGSPPARPLSETKPNFKADRFHVIHKVPAGDSPYVRAKHVQLIEKDPNRAISLFWAAINSGDRVDSALKDMAVVMKQLNRSDEAIEAIKSFRHLCPYESQESLDNVLLELYKRSGRIEEQIEMLRHKVKTIEEGMSFGGKRTKSARSQGKKIQITLEQEYSRLLGNLAWAYLHQNNFRSAEELYRKALSFEADKNKQCNLAICLMHMNRMTEAKLLLQTVRVSPMDGQVDDSYVKSFERATEMLTELESRSGEMPIGGEDTRFTSSINRNFEKLRSFENGGQNYVSEHDMKIESSRQTSFVGGALKKGSYSENPYERTADLTDGSYYKKAYDSPVPAREITKVPFTQPRRCMWSFSCGDQRRTALWGDSAVGGCSRKLSFEKPMAHENCNRQVPSSTHLMSNASLHKSENGSLCPVEAFSNGNCDRSSNIYTASRWSETVENKSQKFDYSHEHVADNANPSCKSKTSWADMVEEDEQELLSRCSDEWYGDDNENLDSNIVYPALTPVHETDKLNQKIESFDIKDGYCTQPESAASSMNKTARRSLCFDQQQKQGKTDDYCSSPLPLKFEGNNNRPLLRKNRLQVFKDITLSADSPR